MCCDDRGAKVSKDTDLTVCPACGEDAVYNNEEDTWDTIYRCGYSPEQCNVCGYAPCDQSC